MEYSTKINGNEIVYVEVWSKPGWRYSPAAGSFAPSGAIKGRKTLDT
jgi:hypothetical protein